MYVKDETPPPPPPVAAIVVDPAPGVNVIPDPATSKPPNVTDDEFNANVKVDPETDPAKALLIPIEAVGLERAPLKLLNTSKADDPPPPPPAGVAHVPSPLQKVEADALVPEFRFVTGKFPVTSVESETRPVTTFELPATTCATPGDAAGRTNDNELPVTFTINGVLTAIPAYPGLALKVETDNPNGNPAVAVAL